MTLPDAMRHYIAGQWVQPLSAASQDIINPATEESIGCVALGNQADVDAAVSAARSASASFSRTTIAERVQLLQAINARLEERSADLGDAISQEMGAPIGLAHSAQAGSGPQHFAAIIDVLETFQFEHVIGSTLIRHEPIGVCGLITPWNWPLNQIAAKVAPAIAAGCTMVLKPSENAPLDAVILAEIMDEVGVPPGVFNLVQGDGQGVGAPLCRHRHVDMVSFTGSTRAGVAIAKSAADSVKRVALELGGKSACIVLEDADLAQAIPATVQGVMLNSGQSCNATTRILVARSQYAEAARMAAEAANAVAPSQEGGIGPIANRQQFERVRKYIAIGIKEGATLLAGGQERPEGFDKGFYVQPTVFGDVTPDMAISREEIFGPVVTLSVYEDTDDAVDMANDSEYGLSGAVWGADSSRANAIAAQMRTGMVHINGAGLDSMAPFGGYKMSGNGREWGVYGLHEFLEVKSIYDGAIDRISSR